MYAELSYIPIMISKRNNQVLQVGITYKLIKSMETIMKTLLLITFQFITALVILAYEFIMTTLGMAMLSVKNIYILVVVVCVRAPYDIIKHAFLRAVTSSALAVMGLTIISIAFA